MWQKRFVHVLWNIYRDAFVETIWKLPSFKFVRLFLRSFSSFLRNRALFLWIVLAVVLVQANDELVSK